MTFRDYAASILGQPVGCHSGACIWGAPNVQTNGGCQCLKGDAVTLRYHLRLMAHVAESLAKGTPF